MVAMSVWPTDGADGSVATEARWRKMARLWVGSGVDPYSPLGLLVPTLAAGPVINVTAGAVWLDGHYAELAAGAPITATANGLLVARVDPAANTAELVYRDGVTTPAQNPTGIFELPIAQMTGGAMADKRIFADPGNGVRLAQANRAADATGIASGTSSGITATLAGVRANWLVLGIIAHNGSIPVAASSFLNPVFTGTTTPLNPAGAQITAAANQLYQSIYVGVCVALGGNVTLNYNMQQSNAGVYMVSGGRATVTLIAFPAIGALGLLAALAAGDPDAIADYLAGGDVLEPTDDDPPTPPKKPRKK